MNAIEVKKLTLSYITSKYSDTINAIETEIRKAAESCKFTVVYKNFSSVAEIEAMVNYFKANGFLTDWDINTKSLIIFWNVNNTNDTIRLQSDTREKDIDCTPDTDDCIHTLYHYRP